MRSRRSSNCRRGCCLLVGVYAGRLLQSPTHKLSNLRKRSSGRCGESRRTQAQNEASTRPSPETGAPCRCCIGLAAQACCGEHNKKKRGGSLSECAARRRQRHENTKSNECVRTYGALVLGAVARIGEPLAAGAALEGLLAGMLRGGGRDAKGRGERKSAASRRSACVLTVRSCVPKWPLWFVP